MAELTLEFQIKSPINKVWDALTHSDTLAQWVKENNFRPIVGYKCQFRNEKIGLIVDSEVLVVDKPNKLSYSWVGGPINTVVTWTLKQEGDTTHLYLVQSGFEQENQAFNGAKYGWTSMVDGLKELLNQIS
ncbi:SRPBCC domain-containing protein [Xylanibacillus composti]|uniref:Activator of HSP90 ATPase n=1 Tax=Xylanibacillus composti TaxID=1572762 RepID=A0A8J4H3P1_9BACL|nr:SRPBCC domain-containing protein [Xylanibacillus composti]MDT9727177.1 SRPBCC domain-containing protein [Xylanibacillus composti]GIQ70412.1 activator of HSP90 ATPase [Xylanibacillus composti]